MAIDSTVTILQTTAVQPSLTTLSEPGGIVNALIEDHDGHLVVGAANGAVYRYNTNSWAVETLSLSHGSSIVHLEEVDNSTYIAGTQNGKLTMIDGATFSEEETYTSQGSVIGCINTVYQVRCTL